MLGPALLQHQFDAHLQRAVGQGLQTPHLQPLRPALGQQARPGAEGGAERLRVRRLETLANGALEMGVKLVLEKRRPEHERSPSWIERWTTNMGRALDALEAAAPDASRLDMGVITAGVAVTWIGFRHPDYDWKTARPNLVALQAALEARPSFQQTRPDA